MPGIDSYTLDNYGIDGTIQSTTKSVAITSVNASVTIPTNQTSYIVYLLANIPAGTKIMSIGPTSLSNAMAWYNSSSPNISAELALLDGNNTKWRIGAFASNNTWSLNSAQVDMAAYSTAMISQGTYDFTSTTSWSINVNSKPSGFNTDTDMRLAIVANTTTVANLTVSYDLRNLRVLFV